MKQVKYDTATPYCAVYVILRREGKIALVLRKNTDWMNDHYGLPAGKVEKGESMLAAAVREAKEEAGVDIKPENLRHLITIHRNHPDSVWLDVCFEASEWTGEPYNAEPHVHGELAWFDSEDLPDNVIPSIRTFLDCVKNGQSYCEIGWSE